MQRIDFAKSGGIAPVVVQDFKTGEVLMLAYMNSDAWQKTLETGKAWYFSRSKGRLWMKGETSGHVQEVREIYIDCDDDTILIKVEQSGGAACHTGRKSCFYRQRVGDEWKVVSEPLFDPAKVYGEK